MSNLRVKIYKKWSKTYSKLALCSILTMSPMIARSLGGTSIHKLKAAIICLRTSLPDNEVRYL